MKVTDSTWDFFLGMGVSLMELNASCLFDHVLSKAARQTDTVTDIFY